MKTIDLADKARVTGKANGRKAASLDNQKKSAEQLQAGFKKNNKEATPEVCKLYALTYLDAYEEKIASLTKADRVINLGKTNGREARQKKYGKQSAEALTQGYMKNHKGATPEECALYVSTYLEAYENTIVSLEDMPNNLEYMLNKRGQQAGRTIAGMGLRKQVPSLENVKKKYMKKNKDVSEEEAELYASGYMEAYEKTKAKNLGGTNDCDELTIMSEQQIQTHNEFMDKSSFEEYFSINPIEIMNEMPQECEFEEGDLDEFFSNHPLLSGIEANHLATRDKRKKDETESQDEPPLKKQNVFLDNISVLLNQGFFDIPSEKNHTKENQPATSSKRKKDETESQDEPPLKKQNIFLDNISVLLNQSVFDIPSEKNNTSDNLKKTTLDQPIN